MHQARHRHARILSAGIGHVVGRCPGFFNAWNDLTPDRIVRIFLAREEIEKVRRDGEREFITAQQNTAPFFVAKIEGLFELRERRVPVLQLPLPIVPKFGGYAVPIARRVRDELLPIAISKGLHLSKDENAKTGQIRVNARTEKCAAHSCSNRISPYWTATTVPIGISANNFRAVSPGSRIQPCDAG